MDAFEAQRQERENAQYFLLSLAHTLQHIKHDTLACMHIECITCAIVCICLLHTGYGVNKHYTHVID